MSLGTNAVVHKRGEVIWHEDQPASGIYLLLEGWVSSSVLLRSGRRLIQKLHLPGDMLGTPSLVLASSAETLTCVTDAETSFVPEEALREVFSYRPRLSAMLFMAAQMERLTLMDALASAGHSNAVQNLAYFLLDLYRRLKAIGQVSADNRFRLPLSQITLAEILGLTPIHVNRIVRQFDELGLIERSNGTVRLLDLPRLRELSPTSPRNPRINPEWMPK